MTRQVIVDDELIEDEISITDILVKLWRRRGIILSITLLSLGFGLIAIFLSATTKNTPATLFIELSGIKDEKYPNGAGFSPQDLKSPDVLSTLQNKYKGVIKDENVLSKGLNVTYGTELVTGINKLYEQRLAQKGLTIADIQKINLDYSAEIQDAGHRGLAISFDYQSMGLSLPEGKEILNELPRAWNYIYINNHRTLIDADILSKFNQTVTSKLLDTEDFIETDRLLTRMHDSLDTIKGDNRFASITTNSGKSATDILSMLTSFQSVYFTPALANSLRQNNLTNTAYIRDIKLNIAEIDRNLKSLDEISKEIIDFRKSSGIGNQTNNKETSLQFTDNTLSEVLKIANQASLSEYLKTLLDSKRDLAFKRSSLQSHLERIMDTGFSPIGLNSTIESRLDAISADYSSLISNISAKTASNIHSFYYPVGTPAVVTSKWPEKTLLILFAAMITGLVLSTAIALLLPDKSKPPH